MKKYKPRFETLYNLSKLKEEIACHEFLSVSSANQIINQKKESLKIEKINNQYLLQSEQEKGFYISYLEALNQESIDLEIKLKEIKLKEEECRNTLLLQIKKRKTLEILRKKDYLHYLAYERKQE